MSVTATTSSAAAGEEGGRGGGGEGGGAGLLLHSSSLGPAPKSNLFTSLETNRMFTHTHTVDVSEAAVLELTGANRK